MTAFVAEEAAGACATVPVLRARSMSASYGPLRVLYGLDFHLDTGEVVALLGANGAGKTTTLRAISGILVDVTGELELNGTSLVGTSPDRSAQAGIAHVPQGRGTFTALSVEDNLRLGAISRRDAAQTARDLTYWYETFPHLAERKRQQAGSLSGGEQQMLAVARALMMRPQLLLLDEPSLGLAPLVVADLFAALSKVSGDLGATILLVEQNANVALAFADRGYVLEAGRIVLEGSASELLDQDQIQKAYLGQ
jgi:branched-chain amino acid transport system ATP-binding protein